MSQNVASKKGDGSNSQEVLMDQLWTEKEDILNKVLDALEVKYPSGLYDWLYIRDRGAYDEINRLEDAINENFRSGGSVDEFKAVLRQFWTVHMRAILAFKRFGGPGAQLTEARDERIRELESAHG